MQEQLDTTTSGGKLIIHIFAALAEFERDLIRERTTAGLAAARARGHQGGRPKGVDQRKKEAGHSVREICGIIDISCNTYYEYTRAGDQARQPTQRMPGPPDMGPAPHPNVMNAKLWLREENNSRYGRGKGKACDEIERHVLSRFGMEKPDTEGWEYILSISYTTDEELDQIYEEIWRGDLARSRPDCGCLPLLHRRGLGSAYVPPNIAMDNRNGQDRVACRTKGIQCPCPAMTL